MLPAMSTMNISLPDSLKKQVDARIDSGGVGSSSEYVRALVRRDLARQSLRSLLVEGAESRVVAVADPAYFAKLRGGKKARTRSAR